MEGKSDITFLYYGNYTRLLTYIGQIMSRSIAILPQKNNDKTDRLLTFYAVVFPIVILFILMPFADFWQGTSP
jgi:hypothetical protein